MTEPILRDIITPAERGAINRYIVKNGVTKIARGVSGIDYGPDSKHGKHFREAEFAKRREKYRVLIESGLSPQEVAKRMDVGVANVRHQAKNLGLTFKGRPDA